MIKKLVVSLSITLSLVLPSYTFAHSISGEPAGFWYTNLISDSNFLNKDSMDGGGINGFLAGKGSWLTNYTIPEYIDVPYFCRNDSGNPEIRSVSVRQWHVNNFALYGLQVGDLLANRAQANAINPQVMLALLERESSAVTRSAPSSDMTRAWPLFYSFDETMATYGYNCSTAEQKARDFGGVGQQIAYGTFGIKKMYNDSADWQSQIVIDGIGFTSESRATRALYRYTPHIHAGNHNFWYFFNVWFANIIGQPSSNFRIIKGSGDEIYLHDVTNNKKYHVRSLTDLHAWSFSTGDLVPLSDSALNAISTNGGPVTRLIKGHTWDYVYYMENGRRHLIRSELVFPHYGLSWGDLANLPDSLVDQIPYGHSLARPARGGASAEVYIMTNDRKWYIENHFYLQSWGYDWGNIDLLPDSVINPFPPARLDILMKEPNRSEVYAMIGGTAYRFPDAGTFNNYGLRWDRIATFGSETAIQYPKGRTLTRLIKGSGSQVYFMENGFRRHITSPQALGKTGVGWDQLMQVPDYFLNAFAIGAPIN